jgi:polar amino acid transport system permease protein
MTKRILIGLAVLTALVFLCQFTVLREDRITYEWHFEVVFENLPFLLQGIVVTVTVTVITMITGLILGLIAALARLSGNRWLGRPAYIYVEFFRTTPLLVQIIWVYYCMPILLGISFPDIISASIALSLNVGAYLSEIYRAGITSIARGQTEAALALGMTRAQALRRVILPQAVTRMLPPIGNTWISLFKDSSLVSTIAVADLTYQGRVLAAYNYRPLEVLTTVAVLYFVLTYPQSIAVNWLHRKYLSTE